MTPAELTPRQREVAALVAHGFCDKDIGRKLGISYNTVRVHIVALAFRIGTDEERNVRVQIAQWWWQHDGPTEQAS